MIYTVTLNPSVDVLVEMDELILGKMNRMKRDYKVPGGKGITVSRVLRKLGVPTVATGLLGGFTGDFIRTWLQKEGIRTEFTEIDDDSRINMKFFNLKETVINGRGPNVNRREIQEFLYYMSRVREGDTVIMTGNIPPSIREDIYERIIAICQANRADFIVDSQPERLLNFLPKQPLLVRVSRYDLIEIYKEALPETDDVIRAGKKLIREGARYAIVSIGEKGDLFFMKDRVLRAPRLDGRFINSNGARDAMIAGFVSSLVRRGDPVEAFRLSMASNFATKFSLDLPSREEVEMLLPKVEIYDLSRKKYDR